MPSLKHISDPTELDNLYSDKVIVYVEGTEDLAFFNDLVGPDIADRLEFKVPDANGSGYHMVRSRVAMERAANPKIHGLLDGETAVTMDAFGALLASRNILFGLEGEENAGLLFLSEHELENLVLCHARLPDFIAQNVPFALIGTRPVETVERELATLAKRFYLLALLKFAAGRFHAAGTPCKAIDQNAGMFISKMGVAKILQLLKPKIEGAQIEWNAFIEAVRAFSDGVKAHFDAQNLDRDARHKEIMRLADGKSMLRRIRGDYNGQPSWEGLLQGRLKHYGYATAFRNELEVATGCNDNR